MSVVIYEMVHEVGEPAPQRSAAAPAASGGAERQLPDLDRLEFQIGRRRHRAERLWAD